MNKSQHHKLNLYYLVKWTIINTAANFSYTYEIYVINWEYKGIIPDFNNKIERLDKRGDKY